jgi:hypothetical protein
MVLIYVKKGHIAKSEKKSKFFALSHSFIVQYIDHLSDGEKFSIVSSLEKKAFPSRFQLNSTRSKKILQHHLKIKIEK